MEWIKCSERLPEKNGCYLTFDGEMVVAIYDVSTEHWIFDGEGFGKYIFTHWMPLPEPPKE